MNLYEQRIIGGVAAGIVAPESIPLAAEDFESDLGLVLTTAKA